MLSYYGISKINEILSQLIREEALELACSTIHEMVIIAML